MTIGRNLQIRMLETMLKIRMFEERAKRLFTEGKIYGALHLYIGEEASATGVCAALEKDDYVVSTHRGHGHCIARGADVRFLLAELMGKVTGYSRGHGGSMHIFCEELGLLGGNGIVGGGIPIGLGAAYACMYRRKNQAVACFFGDGAANQGTFHESLNMASVLKLPIVYICENNVYAATTRTKDVTAGGSVASRAAAYNVPGVLVDGNDVEAVYHHTSKAVGMARACEGPTLIECRTYRLEDHCMVLRQKKDPEELETWRKQDPIRRFQKNILALQIVNESGIEEMKREIADLLDSAERFAEESPWPDPASLREFAEA